MTTRLVASEQGAVAAAGQLGGPVVLKADVPGLVHKTDAGAVQLDLHSSDEVRAGYRALAARFGDRTSAAMIRSIHAAPLLLGHRGAATADLAALQDLLQRVARLADDLPEVAELDLNPVIARPDGAYVVDARIHLRAAQPTDPYLRQLR